LLDIVKLQHEIPFGLMRRDFVASGRIAKGGVDCGHPLFKAVTPSVEDFLYIPRLNPGGVSTKLHLRWIVNVRLV